ncbi:MAG TPA: hypothetical protein VFZ37_17020 [Jiangellaceae bacterium]
MQADDLRTVLAERAADADRGAPTVDMRLAGVRGKARKIRARRLASAGVAVAAAVVIAISVGNPAILRADDPEPANPSSDLVLPDYYQGGVKTGEARVEGPSTTSSVTVTPGALPVVLLVECDRSVSFTVTKDEAGAEPLLLGGECADDGQIAGTLERAAPDEEPLIEPDEPVTLTLTVDGVYDEAHQFTPGVLPDGGVVLGVYESVPWEEYQFPSRPAELVDLADLMGDGPRNGQVVESVEDPNEPVTITRFVGDGVSIDLRSQTPGRMKIYIDGEEVGSATFWDYTGMSSQYETGWQGGEYVNLPEEGVEITFVPQDFTGAWRADVVQCTQDDDGSVGCGP